MASPTPGQTNLGVAPNVGGLLCYVPCCIGFIFSMVVAIVEKQSRFVRFHAFQSLLLHGAAFVCGIGLQVAADRPGRHPPRRGAGCSCPWSASSWASGLLGRVDLPHDQGQRQRGVELPVIGPMARKWA